MCVSLCCSIAIQDCSPMHAFIQVMLAGPGKRIRIGIQPDEKLSALAWTVSLGKGSVLGVIGEFCQRKSFTS